MKITKLLLAIILISINQYSFAQNKEIKSAEKYYKKAVEFESKNIDSSLAYVEKAYEILKPNDTLNKTFGDILNQFGRLNFHKKEYTKAYTFFNRCFNITQLIGDEKGSFKVKVNMAICQRQLNNTEKALSDFYEVVKFYEEKEPENVNLGITYFNIADLYFNNKQHEFASKYYDKSEPFFKGNKTFQYQLKSNQLANFNSYDLKKSQELISEIESTTSFDSIPVFVRGIFYNNIAQTMVKLQNYDEALSYTLKGLEVKKNGGIKARISIQYNNVGDIYIKQKKFPLAIFYLDSALNYANSNRQKFQILKNLQKAHKGNNDLEKSLKYADSYIALKDSLNEVLTQKEIAELGIKYETDKKEKFIDKLQSLSLVYKVLIFTIILISGFILLRILKKNKLIKSEFEILQQELDVLKQEKSNNDKPTESELINLKSKAILNSSEILYVKSDGHYVEFYLENKTKPEIDRNSLSEVLNSLPSNSFVRIHKSFIVNIYRIKIINSTKVMLDSGVWINLSRTYKQQLKDILHKED